MQESSFAACLTALQQSGVEFILVGGLAAVLQGAPVQTYDVDIVHARTHENVERLLELLNSIDAIFRIQPARRIRPNATHPVQHTHFSRVLQVGLRNDHKPRKKICARNCPALKRLPKIQFGPVLRRVRLGSTFEA
jgi:hypothetical protein